MPAFPSAPKRLPLSACTLVLLLAAGACDQDRTPAEPSLAMLTGRAVLPADTFAPGPAVGDELDAKINGRTLPFASPPVQGFSSLLVLGPDDYLVLQDNGFGTQANSPAYPLRWYRLGLALDDPPAAGGQVTLRGVVDLRDPDGHLPFPLAAGDSTRVLTGADLDPEAIAPGPDGTYWIGEEFGPSLVQVDGTGRVLQKPVDIPIVPPLRDYARGSPFYRSPDHPDLRALRRSESRDELANLPASGGVEGLAANLGRGRLYVILEKGLLDDPVAGRRVIHEFDPARRRFTGNWWFYLADGPQVGITSLEAVDDRTLLVVERDSRSGREAEVKRIYRVELGRLDERRHLAKELVCDLLNISDENGLTRKERGAVGLGRWFSFPYVTPECLAVLDRTTLLVANDNNFPFSSGRRPPSTPDDNEFIRLRLLRPLLNTPE